MNTPDTLRRIAAEIISLAASMETPEPVKAVPVPDLFTQMGITVDETMGAVEALTVEPSAEWPVEAAPGVEIFPTARQPERRHYQRTAKRMTEALMVDTYTKVGKKQGYCNRGDIERTLVRITGRSREDVREAVNRIAERMQITCVKSRSYRYYPRSLRSKIINDACQELERI